MKKRYIVDVIILFVVLIAGFVAIQNATNIGDWWYFRSYTPSAEIEQIAIDAGMSDEGKKLFYRLDPQLVGRATINNECGEKALGCTVGKNIYILNDFTPAQYNRSVVTAAHEMLHVAWSRMGDDEIEELSDNLEEQFKITDESIMDKFSDFDEENYYNESHSYIGTESARLTSELEKHYDRYFDDRMKSVKALKYSPER